MRRAPSSLSRVTAGLFVACASTVVALTGCGSRGPLDEATNVALDAAPEAEPELIDAGVEAEAPLRDAGREAGPVACGICVLTTCGDKILACIQSDGCRTVFQCVATTCVGGNGGALDPLCLFQCAGSDPAGALAVLGVFQCITGECGADCGSLLGGLGGLGGGGKGGNGGNGGNGKGMSEGFHELFSPYPELFTPVPDARPTPPLAPKAH